MIKSKFLKLYESKKELIEKEGKKSQDWFLGFLEGYGNQNLTGYQVGALYHLMVLQNTEGTKSDNENVDSGDSEKISIPGVL